MTNTEIEAIGIAMFANGSVLAVLAILFDRPDVLVVAIAVVIAGLLASVAPTYRRRR